MASVQQQPDSASPSTGTAMSANELENLTFKMTGMPISRIHWVKSPIVTKIKIIQPLNLNDPKMEVDFSVLLINSGEQPAQITSMPMPYSPEMKIFCEGRDIKSLPPRVPPKGPPPIPPPEGYQVAPSDGEIEMHTHQFAPGYVGVTDRTISFGAANLLAGTHIYEVFFWQSHLNWIDVRKFIDKSDAQGRLMYPITDNPPSNHLYFKIYAPTEQEERAGKTFRFFGEVDAKTQAPQFPLARPGDFASKTGFWRAEGGGVEALGEHVVFVKEGESMPNLPGEVGFNPFAFQWRFSREK
jgi:hypothetical protein